MEILSELFGVAGKRVLITGGGRGIGFAIAEGFVRAGARVYICSRDLETCTSAATELTKLGSCTALKCDIADVGDRHRLVEELKKRETSLDVLVNNAGAIWAAPFEDYPEAGWDKVYSINVKGCFFLIQALLPLLQAAASPEDPARIINIGSVNVLRIPTHETYAYVGSKAALHFISRQLAGQFGERSITVNVIAPGRYPSKMLTADIERRGLDEVVAPIPLKRLTSDSDMAGAALYLASKAGAYLTGAVIPVDGGMGTTV